MSDNERINAEVWDAMRHLKRIAAGELPEGRECRVLIVDDSQADVELLCHQLEKFKVYCEFCHSASEAEKKMEVQQFDVIMVDLAMPVIDGVDFIAQALNKVVKGTSFVAITGYPKDAPIVSKAMKLGGMVAFQKPVTDEQLRGIFPMRL